MDMEILKHVKESYFFANFKQLEKKLTDMTIYSEWWYKWKGMHECVLCCLYCTVQKECLSGRLGHKNNAKTLKLFPMQKHFQTFYACMPSLGDGSRKRILSVIFLENLICPYVLWHNFVTQKSSSALSKVSNNQSGMGVIYNYYIV